MAAARDMVIPPARATTSGASGDRANIGVQRATRYTPTVTMVAAWIKALTGVGPSMASGSHTWSGNWADLPTAPLKSSMQAAKSHGWLSGLAMALNTES